MKDNASRGGAHSIYGVELPDDPADLFVVLYDMLSDEHFRAQKAIGWRQNPTVQSLAEHICEDVLDHGYANAELAGDIIEQYGDLGMFAVLIGLDQALVMVNPFSSCYDEQALTRLNCRYAARHRLNTKRTTGLLLPRCTRPGKPLADWTGKPDFFNVHRVTPDHCDRILHGGIPNRNDPVFSGEKPISIGAAPMLEKYVDLAFELHRGDGAGLYRITPDAGRVGACVDTVIENLEMSGASIGVLPESTLSDVLLEQWTNRLRTESPDGCPLEWILLGTGPLGTTDPPPNRALLVDRRTGQPLLEQDKMAGFVLGEGQATRWRLPGDPRQEPAREDITTGLDVSVLETSLGRIAVLICEDIKQSTRWAAKFQAFGVSHIFVPLFASPISRRQVRWERDAAQHCVDELGAWVILSNSLAVGAEMDADPPLDPEDCFNCLVIGPGSRRPTRYGDYNAQFCRADSATQLSRVIYKNDTKVTAAQGEPPLLPMVNRGWAADE